MRSPFGWLPPRAAGIAVDPTLMTKSMTSVESNVDKNRISKLS